VSECDLPLWMYRVSHLTWSIPASSTVNNYITRSSVTSHTVEQVSECNLPLSMIYRVSLLTWNVPATGTVDNYITFTSVTSHTLELVNECGLPLWMYSVPLNVEPATTARRSSSERISGYLITVRVLTVKP
jgi:hypothetical protein